MPFEAFLLILWRFDFTNFYSRSDDNNCKLGDRHEDDMRYTERIFAAILALMLVYDASLAWVNMF